MSGTYWISESGEQGEEREKDITFGNLGMHMIFKLLRICKIPRECRYRKKKRRVIQG